MKKLFLLLLAMALLALGACNEKKSADSAAKSVSAETKQNVTAESGETAEVGEDAMATEMPEAGELSEPTEPAKDGVQSTPSQQIDAEALKKAAQTGQPVTIGEGKDKITIQARPQASGKYKPTGNPEQDAQALVDVLRKAVNDKEQAKKFSELSLDYDSYYGKADKQLQQKYQQALMNNPEYIRLVQEILKNRGK